MDDLGKLKIKLGDMVFDNIKSFDLNDDFAAACASCNFSIVTNLKEFGKLIDTSKLLTVYVNDIIEFTGAIDSFSVEVTPDGTNYLFEARDLLGQLADHYIDPHLKTSAKDTLFDVIKKSLDSTGYEFDLQVDDSAHRNIIAGRSAGIKNNAKTAKGRGKSLDRTVDKNLRPQEREGVWTFIDRIIKPFGLCGWINNAGNTMYIGTPNFEEESRYTLINRAAPNNSDNNMKSSSLKINMASQPAFIVATCKSAPMVKGKTATTPGTPPPPSKSVSAKGSSFKAIYVNEFAGYERTNGKLVKYLPKVAEVIGDIKNIDAEIIEQNSDLADAVSSTLMQKQSWNARSIYMKTDTAHNQEELNFFIKRTMAEHQASYFQYECKVAGFILNGNILNNNTIITLIDEEMGLRNEYWIKSRAFHYSGSGSETSLVLIPKYAYSL